MTPRARTLWAFAVTAIALLMVTLDNLVVTTALPVIRTELNATIEQLEWTVNAYTLTFAVLLLTGAALGDRFGRRRMFIIGVSIFTVASAAAALAPTIETLILARALQGVGGAIVAPLTLTILSAAVSPDKRGVALGAWGAVGGLAIALGPLVGGAVTEGLTWQWIFWINVPIGLLLVPLAWARLEESRGPDGALDLPGLGLASVGLLGIVWAVIHGNAEGWTSPSIVIPMAVGFAALAAFVLWERRAPSPMLPPRFFASRAFTMANTSSLLMSFGMFGAVFLLSQFLQFAQGYSPFGSGLRILPWTLAPIIVAPIAGALSDRVGGGLLMGLGLTLQAIGLAWLGLVITPTVPYESLIVPFIISGVGMGLFFAPVANVVLSAVRRDEEGKASGANNAIREVGGVFGVAVLASIFTNQGGYTSPQAFVDGLVPATLVGAAVVAVGAVAAFAIPRRRRAGEEIHVTATHGQPAHARPGDAEPVYATTARMYEPSHARPDPTLPHRPRCPSSDLSTGCRGGDGPAAGRAVT